MKKTLTFALTLAMLFALCACGAGSAAEPQESATPENEAETVQSVEGSASAAPAESAEAAPTQTADSNSKAGSRVLVVYFSRTGENYTVGTISTGNTAIVGDLIAESVGADVFEIVPVTPYPDSYDECLEVATQEQRSNARPAYVGEVEGWADYDTVFFGYPIWWGDMPMIAYTFLESHDFTGKTVIPFNTHEGSGQSGTQRTIEKLCSGATVIDGLAVRGNTAQNDRTGTQQAVSEWLGGMDFFG